jgi:hypothetical protein
MRARIFLTLSGFVALLWLAFWRGLRHDAEQIAKTVAEQKLLCMAPGTTNTSFNRQLVLQLLLNNLSIWAIGAFFITLISSLLAVPAVALLYQLSLCSMCLPFITATLTDYSSKTAQSIAPPPPQYRLAKSRVSGRLGPSTKWAMPCAS